MLFSNYMCASKQATQTNTAIFCHWASEPSVRPERAFLRFESWYMKTKRSAGFYGSLKTPSILCDSWSHHRAFCFNNASRDTTHSHTHTNPQQQASRASNNRRCKAKDRLTPEEGEKLRMRLSFRQWLIELTLLSEKLSWKKGILTTTASRQV